MKQNSCEHEDEEQFVKTAAIIVKNTWILCDTVC